MRTGLRFARLEELFFESLLSDFSESAGLRYGFTGRRYIVSSQSGTYTQSPTGKLPAEGEDGSLRFQKIEPVRLSIPNVFASRLIVTRSRSIPADCRLSFGSPRGVDQSKDPGDGFPVSVMSPIPARTACTRPSCDCATTIQRPAST